MHLQGKYSQQTLQGNQPNLNNIHRGKRNQTRKPSYTFSQGVPSKPKIDGNALERLINNTVIELMLISTAPPNTKNINKNKKETKTSDLRFGERHAP